MEPYELTKPTTTSGCAAWTESQSRPKLCARSGGKLCTTTSADASSRSLERRWDVEDIGSIGWKEIEIDKTAEGYDMIASYEAERPFIANVYLLVKFDKTVSIPQ